MSAVQTDIQKTKLREFSLPEITADAAILKVKATGVCGSDWPAYNRFIGDRILGHEAVGYIH